MGGQEEDSLRHQKGRVSPCKVPPFSEGVLRVLRVDAEVREEEGAQASGVSFNPVLCKGRVDSLAEFPPHLVESRVDGSRIPPQVPYGRKPSGHGEGVLGERPPSYRHEFLLPRGVSEGEDLPPSADQADREASSYDLPKRCKVGSDA